MSENSIFSGQNTIATSGAAESLRDIAFRPCVVTIKALATNTGDIYIGNADVTSANGFILGVGEEVTLFVDNANIDIYLDCEDSGDGVSFIGWSRIGT